MINNVNINKRIRNKYKLQAVCPIKKYENVVEELPNEILFPTDPNLNHKKKPCGAILSKKKK